MSDAHPLRDIAYVFPQSPFRPTGSPQARARHGHLRLIASGIVSQCSSVEIGENLFLSAGHCLVESVSDAAQRELAHCLTQHHGDVTACIPRHLRIEFRRGGSKISQRPEQMLPVVLGLRPSEIIAALSRPEGSRSYPIGNDFLLFTVGHRAPRSRALESQLIIILDLANISRIQHQIERPEIPCGGTVNCRHSGQLVSYPRSSVNDANGNAPQMTSANCTVYTSTTDPIHFFSTCSAISGSSGGGVWSLENTMPIGGALLGIETEVVDNGQKPRNIGLRLDHILRSIRVMRGMAP